MLFSRSENKSAKLDRFIKTRECEEDLAYSYKYKEELLTRMEVDSPQKDQKEKN